MPPSEPPSRAVPPGNRRSNRHKHQRKVQRNSNLVIVVLVAAAAVGAAFAPAHPTGQPVVDLVERMAFTAVVVLGASRSARWTWLLLAGVTVAFSRGWWILPGAAAGAVAIVGAWQWRRRRRLGALVAALAMQGVLRFEAFGFHGLTALVAAAITVPVLLSGYRHASTTMRRRARWTVAVLAAGVVVCSLPLAVAAGLNARRLHRGAASAKAAFDQVSQGDPRGAAVNLRAAATSFGQASSSLDTWWTAPAVLVPVVSQHRRAVTTSATIAHRVADEAATSVAHTDYKQLTYQHGTLDLAHVTALAGPLEELDATLTRAQGQLREVRTSWLVPPVDDAIGTFEHEVDRALPQTDLALDAVRVAPGLLGGDGVRHYFVAFTTPAEQRGLGGFIGSYAEIVADDGHLTMTRSGPISDLNPTSRSAPRTIGGPPDYLARYGAFHPERLFQDLTYSPDLPTVAEVIAQLYPQAGGDKLDGVLELDPYGLAALLRFTGPIQIAGISEELTPSNAADILLTRQYAEFPGTGAQRKDALSEASRIVFQRLTTGNLPAPKALSDTLAPVVHQGRIGFTSFHPDEEAFIRRIGLDRTFPRPDGGDLLAVTTQNSANNKIDVYLHRTIHDQVHLDPATGQVASTVTVTLRNEAPASGLPEDVAGSPRLTGLPAGTNRSFVSVYTPFDLTGATIDGLPLGLEAGSELGSRVYATTVTIPPGGTATLVLQLHGTVQDGRTYRLALPVQPQVNADQVSVDLALVDGWTVLGHPPGFGTPFSLTEDRTLAAPLHRTG